jgi:hypothetical protein
MTSEMLGCGQTARLCHSQSPPVDRWPSVLRAHEAGIVRAVAGGRDLNSTRIMNC